MQDFIHSLPEGHRPMWQHLHIHGGQGTWIRSTHNALSQKYIVRNITQSAQMGRHKISITNLDALCLATISLLKSQDESAKQSGSRSDTMKLSLPIWAYSV